MSADDKFIQVYQELETQLVQGTIKQIDFDTQQLASWDSRLLALLLKIEKLAGERQANISAGNLPDGVLRMLRLAKAVPPKDTARHAAKPMGFIAKLGNDVLHWIQTYGQLCEFVGDMVLSISRYLRGTAIYYRADLVTYLRQAGPEALSIVLLVNFLVGMILAFMGAVQLGKFGAQIYIADMVAIGLTRELAPMMTAIIMAGRTGAAYAAQLGTMMVNQEVDALKSFGFSPIDFLVTPRLIALILMVPLLVIFADAVGILGGFLISVGMMDVSAKLYLTQTQNAINMVDILYGIFKGGVFGILVAITGCLHGISSGRTASAVGNATTGAVVTGIISIVIATAIFAVLTTKLGI